MQRRRTVAQAQEAMRGHYNYTINSNQSAETAKFWKMLKCKMLYPLLVGGAPYIVLIAVVHPCTHSPFIRDSVLDPNVKSKHLMTLKSLIASTP
jgi:hypothetical protein